MGADEVMVKLKDLMSVIDGEFYIAKRGEGCIRDKQGKPLLFDSQAVKDGKQELPRKWLNDEIIIKPLTWSTLVVEVKGND